LREPETSALDQSRIPLPGWRPEISLGSGGTQQGRPAPEWTLDLPNRAFELKKVRGSTFGSGLELPGKRTIYRIARRHHRYRPVAGTVGQVSGEWARPPRSSMCILRNQLKSRLFVFLI
jgi:hypothetical protein